MAFSIDDAADVGMDEGKPVIEDNQLRDTKLTGKILKVTVDVKAIGKEVAEIAGILPTHGIQKARIGQFRIPLVVRRVMRSKRI
jgi:hypothetical protein